MRSTLICSRRLWMVLALLFCMSFAANGQRGYDNARSLVGRVQHNLRRAERFGQAEGREKDRYANAQRHLSQFDRKISKGKFDKDKLDEAIDDVKNVVEHNTLSPGARDSLTGDLADLRQMRAARGRI